MIEITKYPKIERLSVIETTDNSGYVKIKIYGAYAGFNLALRQSIFVNSENIVGKYTITQLENVADFSFITINKVYASDTANGYILTNPAVNADCSWNSVNHRIDFELQRMDILINGIYSSVGNIAIQIDGNYDDFSLTVGSGIFVRLINETTGVFILDKNTTILSLFYNSGADTSEIVIDEAFTETTEFGFVNSNEYKVNYYVEIEIETKDYRDTFKIRPDSKGKSIFDVSKYLKTKINIEDTFDYSVVSFRDENLGNYFTLSYTEISD